jgi:hypothetical protein
MTKYIEVLMFVFISAIYTQHFPKMAQTVWLVNLVVILFYGLDLFGEILDDSKFLKGISSRIAKRIFGYKRA